MKGDENVKIAIGSDHAAVDLKDEVINILKSRNIEYKDMGTFKGERADYPDIAEKVCEQVTNKACDKGVLLCGTGVGMSMCANKIKGIRACVCTDVFSAKLTVMHNDCNVLCMGERVLGPGLMGEILVGWLDAEFEGGRHLDRVNKIRAIEEKNFK